MATLEDENSILKNSILRREREEAMKYESKAKEDEEFAFRAREVADDIVATLIRKRSGYGSENLTKRGSLGIIIRMEDKMTRIEHMESQGTIEADDSEGILDAWLDLIGYSILGYIATQDRLNQYR
jgi:hypothetical protein